MQLDTYRAFLEDYTRFLEKMAGDEKEKYAAILSYDVKRINRVVSNQQALNMHLAKMEQQREEEQSKAGLEGLNFQQIIERLEGQQREDFDKLFRRFEQALYDIKYFNGKSMSFAQEGLQMLGVDEETVAAPYDASGRQREGTQNVPFFETKI